jgi:hypothetical protein
MKLIAYALAPFFLISSVHASRPEEIKPLQQGQANHDEGGVEKQQDKSPEQKSEGEKESQEGQHRELNELDMMKMQYEIDKMRLDRYREQRIIIPR